jgi:hypothetical protein
MRKIEALAQRMGLGPAREDGARVGADVLIFEEGHVCVWRQRSAECGGTRAALRAQGTCKPPFAWLVISHRSPNACARAGKSSFLNGGHSKAADRQMSSFSGRFADGRDPL